MNIDAEEADRLEISLDLMERLAPRPASRAGAASALSCRPTKTCPHGHRLSDRPGPAPAAAA